jgi:hypothetical protein
MHALLRSKHSHEPRSPRAAAILFEVAGMSESPPSEQTKMRRSRSSARTRAVSSAVLSARAPNAAAVSPSSAK